MKIYAINGSPRKKWNTATIMQNVLDGAAESSDDILTEMINLYDYNFKGCVECYECKRVGGPSYGKCAVHDDIQPILRKLLQADAIVFGSPIFFSDVTGVMRCFLERLFFPCFVYDQNLTSLAHKKIPTGFVYTMNVTVKKMDASGYPQRLHIMENAAQRIFKRQPLVQYVNFTYQFPDYSKYMAPIFPEKEKAKQRELQFPIDCQKAKEMGAALMEAAKKL